MSRPADRLRIRMGDGSGLLAYRHMQGKTVHIYPDCPEGKIIAIAKRDAVHDTGQLKLQGFEWCAWCESKDTDGR